MYVNAAYIGQPNEDIVDTNRSLLVSAVGNYRTEYGEKEFNTVRPRGRGDYQLLYVNEGTLNLYRDKKTETVKRGTMLLFRPGDVQIYSSSRKSKTETFWVHFTGADVEKILISYGIPKNKIALRVGGAFDCSFLFRQMIAELQLRKECFEELLCLYLRQLLVLINRYISTEEGALFTISEIERAANYFNENYNEEISIGKYAKERHIGLSWLINSFKATFKMTPMQYVICARLSNAKNLLHNTDYSISKIASSVGYEDALYFTRLFKRHTGMSPSEYRKRR